ncbi:hypothetical protein NM208_g12983 [Fusarium decemcellulare]|uniref:Uncharacterized protein n=1 Tax=Fusarium decemcellulare TaxID=57161 RepID=A0ACC1RNJ3_9HYPO|nr:hypothetical protein NM208_g12983 [Fusarium decemcellulare]
MLWISPDQWPKQQYGEPPPDNSEFIRRRTLRVEIPLGHPSSSPPLAVDAQDAYDAKDDPSAYPHCYDDLEGRVRVWRSAVEAMVVFWGVDGYGRRRHAGVEARCVWEKHLSGMDVDDLELDVGVWYFAGGDWLRL